MQGEEHIGSQLPAVVRVNHQSKADVVICAKLLRRDIAGVGKKEIKKMPVIGKVLEMGGVVMIDRADSRGAIEAMHPLVDTMRKDGKSVVLAPEGTRRRTDHSISHPCPNTQAQAGTLDNQLMAEKRPKPPQRL